MKALFDFLLKLFILSVILWGVVYWGASNYQIDMGSVFVAWLMVVLNSLTGYLLFEYGFDKESKVFTLVVFGGVALRLLIVMALVLVINLLGMVKTFRPFVAKMREERADFGLVWRIERAVPRSRTGERLRGLEAGDLSDMGAQPRDRLDQVVALGHELVVLLLDLAQFLFGAQVDGAEPLAVAPQPLKIGFDRCDVRHFAVGVEACKGGDAFRLDLQHLPDLVRDVLEAALGALDALSRTRRFLAGARCAPSRRIGTANGTSWLPLTILPTTYWKE